MKKGWVQNGKMGSFGVSRVCLMPAYKYKYVCEETDAVIYILSGRQVSADKILKALVIKPKIWRIDGGHRL